MLFRKISSHLKEQNWYAVFLDLLIVVVGIFLGMQATEWNESRKEKLEEHQYLVRLVNDAKASIREIQSIRQVQDEFNQEIQWAVKILEQQQLNAENFERFEALVVRSTGWRQAFYYTDTIEELLSSGRLTIFRSSDLRSQIARFRVEYDFYNKRAMVIDDTLIQLQAQLEQSLLYDSTHQKILTPVSDINNNQKIYQYLGGIMARDQAISKFSELFLQKSLEFQETLNQELQAMK